MLNGLHKYKNMLWHARYTHSTLPLLDESTPQRSSHHVLNQSAAKKLQSSVSSFFPEDTRSRQRTVTFVQNLVSNLDYIIHRLPARLNSVPRPSQGEEPPTTRRINWENGFNQKGDRDPDGHAGNGYGRATRLKTLRNKTLWSDETNI